MNVHVPGVAHSPQPLLFASPASPDEPQFSPEPESAYTRQDIARLVRASNRAAFAAWVSCLVATVAALAWLAQASLGIYQIVSRGL